MDHAAPATTRAGAPLTLALDISGSVTRTVRLYYRPVNQLAQFKMLEAAPGAAFTIPAMFRRGGI